MLLKLVLPIIVLCSFSGLSYAEDKKVPETPVTILQDATDKMIAGLDENKLKQFYAIENSYRTIRAVEDVQNSVGRAIASCVKNNPEFAKSYNERHALWLATMRPVANSARDKLDKMVLLQGFTQPSSVRKYLKLFDAAVIYRNQGIDTVPIKDKKDCDALITNMDDTQEQLINLLTEALALNQPIQVK